MNENEEKPLDTYRSFLLMSEIAAEEQLSQRDLANRLGIALGLVNSYLKTLVAKGYIRIKSFPRNRYAYLLTPKGIAEKSRLAYQHLSYLTNLYRVAREDYLTLFRSLQKKGVRKVMFCGVDEVTEIAYLSLKETSIELVAVMDDAKAGTLFLGHEVVPLRIGLLSGSLPVVLTSLKKGDELAKGLMQLGIDPKKIYRIGASPEALPEMLQE